MICDNCNDTGLYDAGCRPHRCACGAWDRRVLEAQKARLIKRNVLTADLSLLRSILDGLDGEERKSLERVIEFASGELYRI